MTVNRIILSIMCFAFLLAYHVSMSDVSQFVQKKPEYVDKWFVEVSQKMAENQDYTSVYIGKTDGKKRIN